MSDLKTGNWDFFEQGTAEAGPKQSSSPEQKSAVKGTKPVKSRKTADKPNAPASARRDTMPHDDPLYPVINEAVRALEKAGFYRLVREVEKIERTMNADKFKISVVGEFSKGKSTFINKLFGRDLLPVGNLPTTAILTKITHNPKEMIVFVDSKGNRKALPLKNNSWEGLSADESGADPQGVAFVGINSQWLEETGIEIIDTPGAGDIEQKRALIIDDALLCGDGAVITISAESPLSMTERKFIEQRLIATKIPNLLLIITHLDNLEAKDRARMLDFIKGKLSEFDKDVPVFIPQDDIEIPGADCSGFTGINSIINEMSKWAADAGHKDRKRISICAQLGSIMDIALMSISEKEKLLALDKDKRDEVFNKRKEKISEVQVYWKDLRSEINKRSNKCYEWLCDSVKEKSDLLVERLQYEAAHAGSPQKWWEEDYPYRLKTEMMSLGASIENDLNRIYSRDVGWVNDTLNKQFKLSIFVDREVIADKATFKEMKSSTQVEFEDIDKKRTMARIGTGAAVIVGSVLLAPVGLPLIAASVGVGTGGALLTERFFKGKITEQQRLIKEAIAKDVPRVIGAALAVSEQKLENAYRKVVEEASAQEEMWVKAQLEALESSKSIETDVKATELDGIKAALASAVQSINRAAENNEEL